MSLYARYYYVSIFIFALFFDQSVKFFIRSNFFLGETLEILPFFSIHYTKNTGVAFSVFSHIDKNILILLSIIMIAFLLFFAKRMHSFLLKLALSLIIGGACGNLIDRILYGHVVDYFFFHTPIWSFAIFNLADFFITIGVLLIIWHEFYFPKSKDHEQSKKD